MSDVYLKAWHGGLGDALQFSTLPEEFEKQQGRKTYIVADAPFRNEGIYDLVWDKNPYVHGKKFGEWNAGDLPSIPYREDGFLEENGTGNMIPNWEKFHGLQPTNKYPKIYYEPEKDKGVKDLFIVDFTSTTVSDDPEKLSEVLQTLRKEYSDKKFISVEFSDINVKNCFSDDISFDGYIEVENIFRYCDLISSVYGYVSLHSGGTHLSSALKEYSPNLNSICILSKEWYNEHEVLDNHFLFDNIKYLKY
mgnify:FL=1